MEDYTDSAYLADHAGGDESTASDKLNPFVSMAPPKTMHSFVAWNSASQELILVSCWRNDSHMKASS